MSITSSKMTTELRQVVDKQLELRKDWKSWQLVADLHGISREALFRHIRLIKSGRPSPPVKK